MNTFIPWPVSPSTPAAPFPPGAFCLDLGAGPFSMWFDDQVSFDIVPWHALAAPSQGPTFSVWFNDQGQSQLDATLFREPYAADNDILARYLIADEATAMLDVITQAELWAALMEVAEEEGMGMILVSHSPALVQRVATRVVRLA